MALSRPLKSKEFLCSLINRFATETELGQQFRGGAGMSEPVIDAYPLDLAGQARLSDSGTDHFTLAPITKCSSQVTMRPHSAVSSPVASSTMSELPAWSHPCRSQIGRPLRRGLPAPPTARTADTPGRRAHRRP